jgi:hypothetical protein
MSNREAQYKSGIEDNAKSEMYKMEGFVMCNGMGSYKVRVLSKVVRSAEGILWLIQNCLKIAAKLSI